MSAETNCGLLNLKRRSKMVSLTEDNVIKAILYANAKLDTITNMMNQNHNKK